MTAARQEGACAAPEVGLEVGGGPAPSAASGGLGTSQRGGLGTWGLGG